MGLEMKGAQMVSGLVVAPRGRCRCHSWSQRVPSKVGRPVAEEVELRTSPLSISMDPHLEVDVYEMPSWALVSDVMLLRLTSGAAVEAPVRS